MALAVGVRDGVDVIVLVNVGVMVGVNVPVGLGVYVFVVVSVELLEVGLAVSTVWVGTKIPGGVLEGPGVMVGRAANVASSIGITSVASGLFRTQSEASAPVMRPVTGGMDGL